MAASKDLSVLSYSSLNRTIFLPLSNHHLQFYSGSFFSCLVMATASLIFIVAGRHNMVSIIAWQTLTFKGRRDKERRVNLPMQCLLTSGEIKLSFVIYPRQFMSVLACDLSFKFICFLIAK